MRSIQIYIENKIIDLFNDEQIVVNSTVQNISDISKVFTDFSQTFTIPCSPRNNTIFEHYYNSDVDNTIDHNRRRDARIEINYTPFKEGKIQLEKSDVKQGQPNSYTVTFYGSVVNLKDILLEDKLRDVDYSSLNHAYSGAAIQARIETNPSTTDYDVKYPLITSSRVWQYGSADSRDISSASYPIAYTELFPAVRIKSLIDAIGTTYGITFSGSWLSTDVFNKAYLWFKNKETLTYFGEAQPLIFGVGQPLTNVLSDSLVTLQYIDPASLVMGAIISASNIKHYTQVVVNVPAAQTTDYYLDVYVNGTFTSSFSGNSSQTFLINQTANESLFGWNKEISFKLRANGVGTFTCNVVYWGKYLAYTTSSATPYFIGSYSVIPYYTTEVCNPIVSAVDTDLSLLAPDMKISDFISGLFNAFNLTCYGVSTTNFRIEPLEVYYSKGGVYDITQYVDFENVDYTRPKLYNKVAFSYQQSLSFMNREFYDLFAREYGSLNAIFGYDGGDFEIQLPFESLLHSKFTNTELQVGYALGTDPEYKPYIPKPTILYQGDFKELQSFYFDNGTTTDEVTEYVPFGQDASYATQNYSLNFGSDISSLTEEIELNSLYSTYYEGYLNNLFNGKTRITNVKTRLPLNIITQLDLNDSLLIKDKKYVINSMQTNLTTGDVQLELLSSWREEALFGATYNIDYPMQDVLHAFSIGDSTTITISTYPLESPQFAYPDDITPVGDQIVTFNCLENTTGSTRVNTFTLTIVQNGVTFPLQYITIIQLGEVALRVLESGGLPTIFATYIRVTEQGEKRETE